MGATVQLLLDDSITAVCNLYCKNDFIVTLTILDVNGPSPNSSRTPSQANSLASRRNVSARRGLLAPQLFIQLRIRHASGSTDFEKIEKIDDISIMISIMVNGKTLTFTKDYLLGKCRCHTFVRSRVLIICLGWINSQLVD
jgi:hypothetical protein